MPLICELGWHRADPMARWNNGYYFSRCTRCGQDLVRTAYAGWQVPRGYKVVWRSSPPEQKVPFAVRETSETRATSDAAYVELSDKELPIQEVLRHLNAREIGSEQSKHLRSDAQNRDEDAPNNVRRQLERHLADALQIDRLRIGKVRIGEVRIGAAAAEERAAPALASADALAFREFAAPDISQPRAKDEEEHLVSAGASHEEPIFPSNDPAPAAPPEAAAVEIDRADAQVGPEQETSTHPVEEPVTENTGGLDAEAEPDPEPGLPEHGGIPMDEAADTPESSEQDADSNPPAAPSPPPWIADFEAFMADDSEDDSWDDVAPLSSSHASQNVAPPALAESPTEETPVDGFEEASNQDFLAPSAPAGNDGLAAAPSQHSAQPEQLPDDGQTQIDEAHAEAGLVPPGPVEPAPHEASIAGSTAEPEPAPAPHPRAPEQAPEPWSVAPVVQGRTARKRFWSHDPALRPATPKAAGEQARSTIPFTGQVAVSALIMAGVLGLFALMSDAPGTSSVSANKSAISAPGAAPAVEAPPPAPAPAVQASAAKAPDVATSAGGEVLRAQDIWTASRKSQAASATATGAGTVTASILNCRAAPEEDADLVRKLSRGASVKIAERRSDWMNISHRGRQCWALARYISVTRPA